MPLTAIRYAPVYLTEGREWIDTTSIRSDARTAELAAKEFERQSQSWSFDNKLVRIAKVEIREVE